MSINKPIQEIKKSLDDVIREGLTKPDAQFLKERIAAHDFCIRSMRLFLDGPFRSADEIKNGIKAMIEEYEQRIAADKAALIIQK